MSQHSSHLQSSQAVFSDARVRVALLVEYCGYLYSGSQYQPQQLTIQQVLQQALQALHISASAVSFAGRTDAGVSARGQVCHFDVSPGALMNVKDLPAALNAVLPADIAIRAAEVSASALFNSRRDAEAKWYRYVVHCVPCRSVWTNGYPVLYHPKPLRIEPMAEAAALLRGRHDFKAFQDSATTVQNTVCEVAFSNVTREGDFIIFDIAADRFLYKMVRNLMGQLLYIGHPENQISPSALMRSVLDSKDRRVAASTARPHGLSLMAVLYKSPFNYFDEDIYVQQFKTRLKKMESLQDENLFRKAS